MKKNTLIPFFNARDVVEIYHQRKGRGRDMWQALLVRGRACRRRGRYNLIKIGHTSGEAEIIGCELTLQHSRQLVKEHLSG